MMMKKLLLLFITTLLPIMASADVVEIDEIYYTTISKLKTAEVTSNPNKYSGSIVIPETITYEGIVYTVNSIGEKAFYQCEDLSSVTIGNNVEKIETNAFAGCQALKQISFGNSVSIIESGAFFNCKELTTLNIPKSLKSFGDRTFEGCKGLKSVHITDLTAWCNITFTSNPLTIAHHLYLNDEEITDLVIPEDVISISPKAFSNCDGLTSVTIPNGVLEIGSYAFWQCNNLTKIEIPASITNIQESAFGICAALNSVHIKDISSWCNISFFDWNSNPLFSAHHLYLNDNEVTDLVIPDGVTSISTLAFVGCYSIKSIITPQSLKIIDYGSFYGCKNLSNLIIDRGIETINQNAFNGCSDLSDVYCYAETTPNTASDVFQNSYIEYATLHVPAVSLTKYKSTEPWKNFGNIVQIEKPIYKLTYLVDGKEYKVYELEVGAAITSESEPTKEGYTFSGWSEIPETMPDHDVTVTGSFTINKYKLTYMVDDEEYKTYDVEYNSTITAETAPTKEGYTFSGWSEIPETMPAHDATVTGTFTINKYKLIYMVDGVEYKSFEIEYNSSITPEAEPTKEGYTFTGWSDIPETMPAEDVIVTGTFTVRQYILTYVVDGEVYKEYSYDYGSTITPEAEPTKEGYTFSGWSEIPETMPAKEVYVVGTFTINKYKITYVIDGEVYLTEEVEYGSWITPPNPDNHEGYDFAWNDYPDTMPAHDITINGTYTATGIEAILASEPDVKIFTVSGKPLNKLQKGVNILRYKDGRTRKIVVK